MKKTNVKKLKISRETIIILRPKQLNAVVGGASVGHCYMAGGTSCPTTMTH